MFFTMDEVALIDGLIATYFVADSVSESVRIRYYKTHQHLQDNRTDYADLRNIKEALFFLAPLFHGSIQFEKEIWSVIAKTQRLLKESSPVACEPHPVKRTEKKYKVFPVSSHSLLAAFYAARQSVCFSIGVITPRLRWTRLVL